MNGRATGTLNIGPGTYGTDNLHQVRITKGTGTVDIGESTSSRGAIWLQQNTPSSINYAIQSDGSNINLNTAGIFALRTAGTQFGQFATTANGASYINSTIRIGSTTAPSATLDVTGTMSVSSTSTLNGLTNGAYTGVGTFSNTGIGVFQRGLDAATTAMNINSGTANTNVLQINTDQPNAKVQLDARNSHSLTLALNDVDKVGLNSTQGFTTTLRLSKNQGADVASVAGAITLGSDGNVFEITGTNAITAIVNTGWQNGSEVTLLFTSTASLTDGTANSGTSIGFELAGNVNFTGSSDDSITLTLCEIGGIQRWREKCRSVN